MESEQNHFHRDRGDHGKQIPSGIELRGNPARSALRVSGQAAVKFVFQDPGNSLSFSRPLPPFVAHRPVLARVAQQTATYFAQGRPRTDPSNSGATVPAPGPSVPAPGQAHPPVTRPDPGAHPNRPSTMHHFGGMAATRRIGSRYWRIASPGWPSLQSLSAWFWSWATACSSLGPLR